MTEDARINPCPWCNNPGEWYTDKEDDQCYVECIWCNMRGPKADFFGLLDTSMEPVEGVDTWKTK